SAQRLELGDVHLLDIGEVRNVSLRLGHALRDQTAQTNDLDLLSVGCTRSGAPAISRPGVHECWLLRSGAGFGLSAGALLEICVEILANNPAVGACARHLPQINTRLVRAPADRRRSCNTLAVTVGGCSCPG